MAKFRLSSFSVLMVTARLAQCKTPSNRVKPCKAHRKSTFESLSCLRLCVAYKQCRGIAVAIEKWSLRCTCLGLRQRLLRDYATTRSRSCGKQVQ